MGRVLKVILLAAAIILFYALFSFIYHSCQSTSDQLMSANGQELVVEDESFTDSDDNSEVEIFEEESDDDNGISSETTDEGYIDDDIDEDSKSLAEELFETVEEDNPPATSYKQQNRSATPPKPAPTRSTARSSIGGQYMVVSGNYLMEANAIKMVSRLKNLGYADAEYVIFDGSKYYTVLAQRTDVKSSAQSTASSLKSQGIDSYVHSN